MLVLVLGCSSPVVSPTNPTITTAAAPMSADTLAAGTTSAPVMPATTFAVGDLAGWEAVEVLVGQIALTVAMADEEDERQRGLMRVEDLGDFDGMLFAWEQPTTTGFFMKDTLIPLDLFFFNGEGELIDQTSLGPCSAEPCPVFVADGLFRWVLEAPAGSIESVGKLSLSEAG
ncbi:MAG TPA: DUF192 domain-containing protein [Acidimicrobiia bacterium]|nr:DUF192 domain-containing protein [Acidimicrobiia bacterium]